jgi:hypothetical protein
MAGPGRTGYEQNPRTVGPGTVPAGPPKNDSAEAPQQVQNLGMGAGPIPSKPSATTGPGGASISIPKVGKAGK